MASVQYILSIYNIYAWSLACVYCTCRHICIHDCRLSCMCIIMHLSHYVYVTYFNINYSKSLCMHTHLFRYIKLIVLSYMLSPGRWHWVFQCVHIRCRIYIQFQVNQWKRSLSARQLVMSSRFKYGLHGILLTKYHNIASCTVAI